MVLDHNINNYKDEQIHGKVLEINSELVNIKEAETVFIEDHNQVDENRTIETKMVIEEKKDEHFD